MRDRLGRKLTGKLADLDINCLPHGEDGAVQAFPPNLKTRTDCYWLEDYVVSETASGLSLILVPHSAAASR